MLCQFHSFAVFLAWSSEISRPENKGLAAALSLVEEAKKEIDSYSKGGPMSYADLIQYAGYVYFIHINLWAALHCWAWCIWAAHTEDYCSWLWFSSFYVAQGALKATFLAAAIRKCGGNEEKGTLLYTAYGSSGQVCLIYYVVLCFMDGLLVKVSHIFFFLMIFWKDVG